MYSFLLLLSSILTQNLQEIISLILFKREKLRNSYGNITTVFLIFQFFIILTCVCRNVFLGQIYLCYATALTRHIHQLFPNIFIGIIPLFWWRDKKVPVLASFILAIMELHCNQTTILRCDSDTTSLKPVPISGQLRWCIIVCMRTK